MPSTRSSTTVGRGLATALFVAVSGCTAAEPTAPSGRAPSITLTTTIEGAGFVREEGTVAGALYAVIRPTDWNGDLVVMLHGSVPPDAPLSLKPRLHWWWEPFIDALVDRGYGVAFSSYRVNGIAFEEGAIDSRIVQERFTARFGEPRDTYLVGWSMGSAIAHRLVETSPARYAGFLSVCGGSAGATRSLPRHWNMRILFDHFFPDVLPGDVLTSDFDYLSDGLARVLAAVSQNPSAAVAMASIDQLYIEWSTPQELVIGIAGGLVINGGGTVDDQVKAGGIPFDNSATVYTSTLLSDEELGRLNQSVQRIEGDPNALRWLERIGSPNGHMGQVKMLSLHTRIDWALPIALHGPAFAEILAAAGSEGQHVLRIVDGIGHCEFGFDAAPDPFIDFEVTAFDDLVAWVREGTKPTP